MIQSKTIYEYESGVMFRKGVFQRVLSAGTHRWFGKNTSVRVFDMRAHIEFVGGQEIMTNDGGTVKVSLVTEQRITDAKVFLLGQTIEMPEAKMYNPYSSRYSQDQLRLNAEIRVAMREWVSARGLREVLEQRNDLAQAILDSVQPRTGEWGVELRSVNLLDLSVSGNLRAAYGDLLKAELEGQAAMQRARNEASTMRSLINTARTVRENPGLLELRVLTSGQRPRVNFVIENDRGERPSLINPDQD